MIPKAKDKLLFTPGPLTTSLSVKMAMLHDAGSWHFEFNNLVAELRGKILAVAGLKPGEGYESVLLQGSGTYGLESVLGSAIPAKGKLLVLSNGAYGERIARMAGMLKIDHCILSSDESETPDLLQLEKTLAGDAAITHVAMVHCETTTGILNPVETVGRMVASHKRVFIVDAMSSFGAIPIDMKAASIDFLVSSANKCLEGVPGFCFVIANKPRLLECEGRARSLSLDLFGQWLGFEKNGQFRFTPPTHALLAFAQAMKEWDEEGGLALRGARYAANHAILLQGMKGFGFRPFLKPEIQSFIITAFGYPDDSGFNFQTFYRLLSDNGMIVYPGKLTQRNTFRIGTIGRLFAGDIVQLLHAIQNSLAFMGCAVPVKQAHPVIL
jgi:2-aminoethylphosphonate-pyruvate transaminase